MNMNKRVKVLVVDDSLIFREVLAQRISSDPLLQVVATAGDPFEARDKIIEHRPDVMTCDIEMPRMNGIEFIQRLLPQYPLPVVVVSSISNAVFRALNAGAVDFVTKPDVKSAGSVKAFLEEVILKIKIASQAKVKSGNENTLTAQVSQTSSDSKGKIIAIGASTGGIEAIFNLLQGLSKNGPGIVVVQHIPPVFSKMFAERLNQTTPFEVKEAQTDDYVEKGRVLIAPGDKHMRIKKVGLSYRVECFSEDKVNGHCPSVDVLFSSVAKEAGSNAIGVILTGMGYDGAKGLLAMRRRGARTIGQDEKTAVVYGMPKVAYDVGAVEKQAAINEIPFVISRML
ncbi:protein-glutamate methylesterase/protein-glutamine glutaminase [Desulfotomaculum sp. 1211_IL3151]|uniref:protein-glutamate methylesterase/protein-glutamine glutaminase n=1 Tax=Desulfotomaculum sp. 1211_IL3151 TaxID=3084055 RepID=UPI002FDABB98